MQAKENQTKRHSKLTVHASVFLSFFLLVAFSPISNLSWVLNSLWFLKKHDVKFNTNLAACKWRGCTQNLPDQALRPRMFQVLLSKPSVPFFLCVHLWYPWGSSTVTAKHRSNLIQSNLTLEIVHWIKDDARNKTKTHHWKGTQISRRIANIYDSGKQTLMTKKESTTVSHAGNRYLLSFWR